MYPLPRSPKDDSESDGDTFGPHPPSTNEYAKVQNDEALTGPPLRSRSPFQLESGPPSPSSIADSIFSNSSRSSNAGTTFTPPSDISATTDAKNFTFTDDGNASKLSFFDRLKQVKYSTTPDTPVISPASKSSAYQSTEEDMEELSIGDDDDELSAYMSTLSLGESSPSPQERSAKRKNNRQALPSLDDYSDNLTGTEQTGHEDGVRQRALASINLIGDTGPPASRSESVEPEYLYPAKRGRDRSSFCTSNGESSNATPSITINGDDETRQGFDRNSGIPAQLVPTSDDDQRLKPTQSTYKAGHRRSISAPQRQSTAPQVLEDSTSREIRDTGSLAKSKEVDGTLLVPAPRSGRRASSRKSTSTAKGQKLRRSSTGSLQPPGCSSRVDEPMYCGNEEPTDGTASVKSANHSRVGNQTSSSARRGITQSRGPGKLPKFPELRVYHGFEFKSQNDLKNEILEAIRGESPSKWPQGIRSLLRSIKKWWRRPADIDGYVYIIRSRPDAFPGQRYVKIGMTTQKPEERKKQWKGRCKFEFVHVQDDNDKRFPHCNRAEKIIHAELFNERRRYECNKCHVSHLLDLREDKTENGGREHGEWFEISEEKALEVVNKWRKWIIESRPYKRNGTLRAGWLWKLNQAFNTNDLDWNAWFKFTKQEHFQCALQRIDVWASIFLPMLVGLLLYPGFVLGLGLIYPFYYYGVGLQACLMCSGILFLYVLYWFKYN